MANILIVDDENNLRIAIKAILEKEGHNTVAVGDAIKAQQMLNNQNFDVVLTDICMPKVSGVELLRSIHNISPDIKVILITGNPTLDTAKEAIRANAFDYLTKPVSRMELCKAVKNAVQMKNLEEENRKYRENLERLVEEQTQEIRENERKYRLLAENASDVIWTVDFKFKLTYISPSITRLLGFKPEELYDSFFKKILTPEAYNNALKFLKNEFSREARERVNFNPAVSKILEFEHKKQDNSIVWAEIKLNLLNDISGQPIGVLGITRDISDRKKIELELMESEENFRNLAENAIDGILIALEGGTYVYSNHQATRITGYRPDDLLTLSMEKLLAPEENMKIINFYKLQVYSNNRPDRYESVILRKDGTKIDVEISSTKTIWHGSPADLIFLRDISEKKRGEENLEKERDRIRQYLDIVDVILVAINSQQEVTLINRKGREILGYQEDEILGRNWFTNFLPQNEFGHALNIFRKFLEGELEPFYYNESRILTKKREERIIAWRNVALYDDNGNITGILSSGEDITNKLAMEVQLRSSEKRLNTIINCNADGIVVTNDRGIVLFVNPAAEKMLGKRTMEIIGNPVGFHISPNKISEIEILHKMESTSIIAEMNVVDIEWAGKAAYLIVMRDISEQKKAKDNIVKLSQFQKSIIDNANVWLYVRDDASNIIIWNKAAEKISGYTQQEVVGNNFVWEWLYPDKTYREQLNKTINSRLEENSIIENFETTVTTRSGEKKTILWYIRNMYNSDNISVSFLALGRDITMQKSTEDRLQTSFHKLQRALNGAIEAVITLLEYKDPYTSGHQKRVAEIAKAIALEMELPIDTVEAVYIAGSMHDIGKISVPTEILSKPGKLTEPEFSLIKKHPEIGYNIIKPLEFPWPIADIILQHHEVGDGSGYPQGLQEDEICIEAKILSVADVIEAISSDRPYRPALGIDEAINEIIQFKGSRYNEKVVAATLCLFYEKKFNFGIPVDT